MKESNSRITSIPRNVMQCRVFVPPRLQPQRGWNAQWKSVSLGHEELQDEYLGNPLLWSWVIVVVFCTLTKFGGISSWVWNLSTAFNWSSNIIRTVAMVVLWSCCTLLSWPNPMSFPKGSSLARESPVAGPVKSDLRRIDYMFFSNEMFDFIQRIGDLGGWEFDGSPQTEHVRKTSGEGTTCVGTRSWKWFLGEIQSQICWGNCGVQKSWCFGRIHEKKKLVNNGINYQPQLVSSWTCCSFGSLDLIMPSMSWF